MLKELMVKLFKREIPNIQWYFKKKKKTCKLGKAATYLTCDIMLSES